VITQRTWRDRWPATPQAEGAVARQLEPERLERSYGSVGAYQHDAAMLAKEGWQVTAVGDRRGTEGAFRVVVGSWLRGRRRVAPSLLVSYRRLH
jgi:hypothetical protein